MMKQEIRGGTIPPTAVEPYNQTEPVVRDPEVERAPFFVVGIVVTLAVLVTLGLVLLLQATRGAESASASAKISQLDASLKQTDNTTTLQRYTALDTVASHMQKLRNDRFLFLPEWQNIKDSVPSDVQFSSLALGEDHSFRISGTAKSVSSIASFSQSLESKPELSVVTPLAIDRQSDGKAYNFTVTFTVTPTPSSTPQSGGTQ